MSMPGKVRIEGENVILELAWADAILGLKKRFKIPLKHILSVSTERVGWTENLGMKVGTSLPGVLRDGRFLTPKGWVFMDTGNPDKCITIALIDEDYKKVVLQVDDKESAAKLIHAVMTRGESEVSHPQP
jgi:hypothetical protein